MVDTIPLTQEDRSYLLKQFESLGYEEGDRCLILANAGKLRLKQQIQTNSTVDAHLVKKSKQGITYVEVEKLKVIIENSCSIEDKKEYERRMNYREGLGFIKYGVRVYLELDVVLGLFDQFIIRSKNLSWTTFKRLTGKIERKKSSVSVKQIAVQFFCAALCVELTELSYYGDVVRNDPSRQPTVHERIREEKTASERFNQCVSQNFNYCTELENHERILLSSARRIQLYYLIGDNSMYLKWMIKRIKYQIQELSYLNDCVMITGISLDSPTLELDSNYLKRKMKKKVRWEQIEEELKSRNVIIVIENVDRLHPDSLQRIIIEEFWQELCQMIEVANQGFLIMIWISQNEPLFKNKTDLQSIPQLIMQNRFEDSDISQIVPKLAIALNDRETWNEDAVNWLIAQSNGGEPEKTVEALYEKFKVSQMR